VSSKGPRIPGPMSERFSLGPLLFSARIPRKPKQSSHVEHFPYDHEEREAENGEGVYLEA